MDQQLEKKILSLSYLVGNTPLLAIEFKYGGNQR
jgi:hypothetical protein